MASNVPKDHTLKKWSAEFCRLITKRQKKRFVETTAMYYITRGSNNWQRSAVNEHTCNISVIVIVDQFFIKCY